MYTLRKSHSMPGGRCLHWPTCLLCLWFILSTQSLMLLPFCFLLWVVWVNDIFYQLLPRLLRSIQGVLVLSLLSSSCIFSCSIGQWAVFLTSFVILPSESLQCCIPCQYRNIVFLFLPKRTYTSFVQDRSLVSQNIHIISQHKIEAWCTQCHSTREPKHGTQNPDLSHHLHNLFFLSQGERIQAV